MKAFSLVFLTLALAAAPAFATVIVSDPYNLEEVGPSVHFVATANTTCAKGVASMGVYINDKLIYVSYGVKLDKWLPVNPGWSHAVVEEWDYCGGATYTSMKIDEVDASGAGGAISASGQQSAYGVRVSSPAENSTVSSPATYIASASTSCAKGVGAMGIYVNDQLVYVVQGANLNHQLPLASGAQHTVVEEWDDCGGSSHTAIDVHVNGQDPGTTLQNLQNSGGWRSWGEFPPVYAICDGPCPGLGWQVTPHVSSPSLSGNSTQFSVWGTKPYSDVLWNNPILGQGTTQNIPDTGHTLLPTLHNFTYDTDVYVSNVSATEALEFDINLYMNGVGMTWGTQCDHLDDGDWDIWDNQNAHWVSTGVACNLRQGWNHVTIHVQRSDDNQLFYQSITFNGVTANLDRWYPPYSVPSGWWGVALNYQMDGNYKEESNTTYLDNFSFNYY